MYNKNTNKPKLILVSGAWGSGTSAIAGALVCLGYSGLGPFYVTNDERTRNSYELIPFRNLILRLASEPKIKVTERSEKLISEEISCFKQQILNQDFGPYDPRTSPPLFVKYPLSALLISELAEHFDVLLIVVSRPISDIEKTRRRRNWPSYHGAQGANIIYPKIFETVFFDGIPAYFVHYPNLLRNPEPYIREIIHLCGYIPSEIKIDEAIRSIADSPAGVVAASAGDLVNTTEVFGELNYIDKVRNKLRNLL
jgi:hypothetical protein